MKIISVVGTRPQFIKLAALTEKISRAPFKKNFLHKTIHTGQHYDYEMSRIFFQQLSIPEPDYNLNVGSNSPSKQIGRMMEGIEEILLKEKPDIVVVYGDTNSTLAGALSASHLHIPVAHVEAGLRSFNMEMPEEINRILTDKVSSLLFSPTETAVRNLKREGQTKNVFLVGDVMYDIFLYSQEFLENRKILQDLSLAPKEYLLLTIHRKENIQKIQRTISIIESLAKLKETVVFPVHPGARKILEQNGCHLKKFYNIRAINPVGYLDMLYLEKNARKIITDSGGVQKEAYWSNVPCIVLREETEWKELTSFNMTLVGSDINRLLEEIKKPVTRCRYQADIFGKGNASVLILKQLLKSHE
ncbi:MAG: UDP-N-acetylglucosamine 2-epimerase (non-hydrolyzing) [Candidatus Omnitrophica bacterium]|nr:UDP-N-acetylglucosamine 2-epimerase (non-hydrolyzing) [Candidatus Omnitrophota bacterium]